MTKEIFTGLEEAIIDKLALETGQCHLFAIELGKLAKQDYTIFIGIRSEYSDDLEDYLVSFSHAVVDINGVDYDCRGASAIDRWEEQWDTGTSFSNSTFEWVALENSPSIEDVTDEILNRNLGYVLPNHELADEMRELISANINLDNTSRPSLFK